ncbi:DUF3598 family protein [Nocardioides yefusunii]|uniref:DUF3598 family protein n=1 Tax=Nocardioides yefusunii TaxID=2500546 RepID=A0ABW1QSQ2_9ACTN|nr:DUF3598 family protein [Nocardioides yefusunii]
MTSINEILTTKVAGVWEGSYTILTPSGEVLDHFASRQEGRMDGDEWYERVVYLREGQEPYEHFYRATVTGDDVRFHNTNMWGSTSRVDEEAIVFAFGWHDNPGERIIEMTRPEGDLRSRVWQHFTDGELVKLTVIKERRVVGATPVVWDPATTQI